jgi:selenium-binding protein 1
MGAADGTAPGRVAEFDGKLHFIANHFGTLSLFEEWPKTPPVDGFNPHGISIRPDLNLMMTSDFVLPASTLNVVPGDPVVRGSVRIWDYRARKIKATVMLESPDGGPALGSMDVKLVPNDPRGIGYASGMFDGHIYMVDPIIGTATAAFDCATEVTPHVDTPVPGGMGQILVTPPSGDRLIFALFQAGQVVMADITDRAHLKQIAVASFGVNTGPHNMVLSNDDQRLVVADYFLNEDDFGKIHFEGDHKVRVLKLTHDSLTEDPRFQLDFNTAFPTGSARPHGLATK